MFVVRGVARFKFALNSRVLSFPLFFLVRAVAFSQPRTFSELDAEERAERIKKRIKTYSQKASLAAFFSVSFALALTWKLVC